MKKNIKKLFLAAGLLAMTGILLTGCSTEADEKTAVTETTTTAAETTTAGSTATEEKTEGGALAGKKISVMTPYLTSVTTNQMAGYIKEDLIPQTILRSLQAGSRMLFLPEPMGSSL